MANNITSLALEGGGGKGNAYLGCIQALENYGLLRGVTEYAGTSAGAITAFLLSMGHSYEKIRSILISQNFNEFFDLPDITREITLNGPKYKLGHKPSTSEIRELYNSREDILTSLFRDSPLDVVKILAKIFGGISIPYDIPKLTETNPVLGSRLAARFNEYFKQLVIDLGLFSGTNVLAFFEKLSGGLTFTEHNAKYKKTLKLVASNFQTGQMQVFSHKTTPNFPVALAVRMSMSLPAIYKPVRITPADIESNLRYKDASNEEKLIYGVWVDGGIFDNAPVRYSDEKQTLLLRLGRRYDFVLLDNFTEFIRRWATLTMLGGIGSGQVTNSTFPQNRIIQLDIAGTDLLKFSLKNTELQEVEKRNYKITDDFLVSNKYVPKKIKSPYS